VVLGIEHISHARQVFYDCIIYPSSGGKFKTMETLLYMKGYKLTEVFIRSSKHTNFYKFG
jgi:hypothetical protein